MLRCLNRSRISYKISITSMLEKFGQLSINQLAVQIKLIEVWKSVNVPGHPLRLEAYNAHNSDLKQALRVRPNRVYNDSAKYCISKSSFHIDAEYGTKPQHQLQLQNRLWRNWKENHPSMWGHCLHNSYQRIAWTNIVKTAPFGCPSLLGMAKNISSSYINYLTLTLVIIVLQHYNSYCNFPILGIFSNFSYYLN